MLVVRSLPYCGLIEELRIEVVPYEAVISGSRIIQLEVLRGYTLYETEPKIEGSSQSDLSARKETVRPLFRNVAEIRTKLQGVGTVNPTQGVGVAGRSRLAPLAI